MTWAIPSWLSLALLALAAYRTYRLIADDEILDPVRDRLAPDGSKRAHFIACAACLGAWVSLGWWLAWCAWPFWTLVVAAPAAISAVVILIAKYGPD